MKIQTDFSLLGKLAFRLMLVMIMAGSLVFQGLANENLQDPVTITGTVTDANSGEPLPGVTVAIKGTSTGTITDVDGLYSISAFPSSVIQFSYVGYLTEEITVYESTTIDVSLVVDVIGLDEVIVTGYGVQKKSDITGSIASVSGEQLAETHIVGVDQALQGLAAGVNVIPVSGRPGDEAVIQIRGISSINGVAPLIIIDGVPGSLENISPGDIESIEVLKDASSAAIYGDSGGNGVIIITTKKGKSGKITTNFNMYQGFEKPVSKLDLMNSQQWLQMAEEQNAGNVAITSRPDTFPNYDWQEILFDPAFIQNYDISFSGGNDVSTYHVSATYTDQSGIIKSSDFNRFTLRINSEHKLTKRITFDEKISYINRLYDGFPDNVWNNYYEGPVRLGLTMPPYVPAYNDTSWANSPYSRNNPLARLDMINRIDKRNEFFGNLGLKIDIVKGLSYTSRFAGELGFWDTKEFQNSYYNTVYDFRLDNEVKTIATIGRDLSYTAQQLLEYNFSLADAHNVSIMLGLEAIREWGYDYNGERYMTPDLPDYLQYFSQAIDDTSINQIIDGKAYESRRLAYFGRLNYDYKGKYLLTVNVRRSGSSAFGPKKRFGWFPAFSLGWKFSEEEFMKNQNLISFGKVRFGYGQTGTYARTGYPYLSIVRSPTTFAYPFDDAVSSPGAAPVQIANPEIHWETIHMTNVGLDLALFQNRLTLTAEYYNKVNEDMLMLQEIPYHLGTYTLGASYDEDNTAPEVNIGSIRNSGLEFTVGYKNNIGDLKYGIDLNLATLKNEVLDLASDSIDRGSIENINPITMTCIGGSVSEFYGYQTDGIYTREDCAVDANGDYIIDAGGRYTVINQPYYLDDEGEIVYAQPAAQPGDVRWVDVNGDGRVLTDEDKVSLGSPLPKVIYGFSFDLEYKGFDLTAQFTGTIGNKIFNGTKQYLYYYRDLTNRAADFANRYVDEDIYKEDPYTGTPVLVTPANRNTDLPRNNTENYTYASDFFVENGSYLRLRNLILGYTLPSSLTRIINVERLRVFVGARNLFTWTKYTGINPEIGTERNAETNDPGILNMGIDVSIYPVTKMYYWGVNLTF